jgi:hypothetical protein
VLNLLASRLVKQIVDRGRVTLDSGATIQGEAWTWSGQTLTMVEKGRGAQSLRVGDITSYDIFDQHLCVWTKDSDLPAARIPEFSSNVHLLSAMLGEKMTRREGPSPGLGRVLFERKASNTTIVVTWIVTALFAMAFLTVLIFAIINADSGGLIAAGVLFVIMTLCQLCLASCRKSYFRCHENGVSQRGLLSQNELRYDEIATFTYEATRHYHNGAYTGTILNMKFEPTKSSGDKPIKYGGSIMNADESLDRLRIYISGVMGRTLFKAYQAGTPIVWTTNLRLIPGSGVEFRPAGFIGIGRKEPVLYPWDQIINYSLEEGALHVWVKDKDKSVIQEPCSAANFFPGLALFATLFDTQGVAKEEPEENTTAKETQTVS